MVFDALWDLLASVGLADTDRVGFLGEDPVLRTRFRIGTAAAAAYAAIGVAANELWKRRGGSDQRIGVDVRTAALSLRGSKHVTLDGKPTAQIDAPNPWTDGQTYAARDGRHLQLSMFYPHHRDAVLQLLGNPADVRAARAAVAACDAFELEEAVNASGGVGAVLRTHQEWMSHPQSTAIASLQPVEIARMGDASTLPMKPATRPLSGVRVLELTRLIAGPACGRMLVALGADVLKINPQHLPDAPLGEQLETGLGKLSAFVDLRTAAGNRTLRELMESADVFVQSYRPGSLAARGFSCEQAARVRPGIVYAEVSAWGAEGPWSGRRGFDSIVQAATGLMEWEGTSSPLMLPVAALDYCTGLLLTLGILVALGRREREGGSWLVRASLARTSMWIAQLGLLEQWMIADAPREPGTVELERISLESDSPLGRVRYLKPALNLSETPLHWERPVVALGSHQPAWPTS